jgi:hypothetical protein
VRVKYLKVKFRLRPNGPRPCPGKILKFRPVQTPTCVLSSLCLASNASASASWSTADREVCSNESIAFFPLKVRWV